ncbi:MAG TPA: GNAT family N-acetyltransferase [Xanthomonadaceae bacterium]|nr:GNAT family N-acetyltransferase [Xanthomonadaceae bacterium]
MQLQHRSPTIHEYRRLRDSTGWWKVDEKAIEAALSHSLFSVVAIDDDDIAGLGRIVGDGGLYFYVQDLIVRPDFQKNGLGKRLMAELMSYITAHAKPGAFVGLMAARGLRRYYESFGFQARPEDAPGMFQVVGSTRTETTSA